MKQKQLLGLSIALAMLLMIAGCKKTVSTDDDRIREYLQTNLSPYDFSGLDFEDLQKTTTLVRIGFKKKNILHDAVVLQLSPDGSVKDGRILHIEGGINAFSGKPSFNGTINYCNLDRSHPFTSAVVDGFIKALHTGNIQANSLGVRLNVECADCTIPEVIVSSTPKSGGGFDWSAWWSLMFMFNDWPPNDYIPVDYYSGGGGGGGNAPAPVITIDPEAPENKEKIEPKKYTDCFGTIPDNSTTLYTVTISTDLPTDGHPEIFYNWKDASPGHAFITLNKSTPYGGVSQNFGFYPTSSYKLITLDNINLPSKIVDDGGHEYQGQYTISVTPAQFQSALGAVNAARDTYNVANYNCTDFALGVFNAAGGNLSIPRHAIPGFEVDGGSNTPQGLYEKIKSMKDAGTAGTTTTNSKEYGSSSKGPCN